MASSEQHEGGKRRRSSSVKDKLHHIGEKLALVPPRPEELTSRLEQAEASGDQDAIHKAQMRIAANNQDAATGQEGMSLNTASNAEGNTVTTSTMTASDKA